MYYSEHQTKRCPNFKRKSPNKTAHKNLRVFSQRNGPVNKKWQSKKGPQIIHKTLKTNSTLDYCSMGSGEQVNQISSKSRSFQCKIYESAQFPSTLSRVKCLFFRRAKNLNRRCQCDVNLKKLVLRLSLFFPRTRRCTFRQTQSLAGCWNNDDSDGKGNGNGKRAI